VWSESGEWERMSGRAKWERRDEAKASKRFVDEAERMGWRGVCRTSAIAAVVVVGVLVLEAVVVVLANALGVVGRAAEQRRHACAGQLIGVGEGAAMAGMWC
jgi:hypothetical protein